VNQYRPGRSRGRGDRLAAAVGDVCEGLVKADVPAEFSLSVGVLNGGFAVLTAEHFIGARLMCLDRRHGGISSFVFNVLHGHVERNR
jgi:hypothetical protein